MTVVVHEVDPEEKASLQACGTTTRPAGVALAVSGWDERRCASLPSTSQPMLECPVTPPRVGSRPEGMAGVGPLTSAHPAQTHSASRLRADRRPRLLLPRLRSASPPHRLAAAAAACPCRRRRRRRVAASVTVADPRGGVWS